MIHKYLQCKMQKKNNNKNNHLFFVVCDSQQIVVQKAFLIITLTKCILIYLFVYCSVYFYTLIASYLRSFSLLVYLFYFIFFSCLDYYVASFSSLSTPFGCIISGIMVSVTLYLNIY